MYIYIYYRRPNTHTLTAYRLLKEAQMSKRMVQQGCSGNSNSSSSRLERDPQSGKKPKKRGLENGQMSIMELLGKGR